MKRLYTSTRPYPSLAQWFAGEAQDSALPRIMVLDGGVSTHLAQYVGGKFDHKELWSSSLLLTEQGRNLIVQGHRDWLKAKANVISTVTYQLHYESAQWPKELQWNNNDDDGESQVTELWKTGIALARQAQQQEEQLETMSTTRPTFVLASSGCYGAALSNGAEYTGDYGFVKHKTNKPLENYDEDALLRLESFHQRKLDVSSITADLTAIETVPSHMECKALARLLMRRGRRHPPCYISFSCRNGSTLNDGTMILDALKLFRFVPNDRLVAFGFNCCAVEHLKGLLPLLMDELLYHYPRGIVLYPNSGETWDSNSGTWLHDGSDDVVLVDALMDHIHQIESSWFYEMRHKRPRPGILVGGCCRTTPSTIALLQDRVQQYLLLNEEN